MTKLIRGASEGCDTSAEVLSHRDDGTRTMKNTRRPEHMYAGGLGRERAHQPKPKVNIPNANQERSQKAILGEDECAGAPKALRHTDKYHISNKTIEKGSGLPSGGAHIRAEHSADGTLQHHIVPAHHAGELWSVGNNTPIREMRRS